MCVDVDVDVCARLWLCVTVQADKFDAFMISETGTVVSPVLDAAGSSARALHATVLVLVRPRSTCTVWGAGASTTCCA